MPNSDTITKETIIDTLQDISKQADSTLESCIKTLGGIRDSKKINESNLRQLVNVWRELDSLRDLFFTRILNSLKRGDMIKG